MLKLREVIIMAANENSKDLLSVLWAGADILRGKMDANEYKNYLLGIVFYKYLSDTFLTHVYDLLYNKKPESMAEAQAAYEEIYSTEDAEELLEDIKESYHYTIKPELTYTKLAESASKKNTSWLYDEESYTGNILRYHIAI